MGILKESEAGLNTGELRRKHGISQQTFYRWKATMANFVEECLNEHWFLTADDARETIEN